MPHINSEIFLIDNSIPCSECGCGRCTATDSGRKFQPNQIGAHNFTERSIPTSIGQCVWNLLALEMLISKEDFESNSKKRREFTKLEMQQIIVHMQFLDLLGLAPLVAYLKQCFEEKFGSTEAPITQTTTAQPAPALSSPFTSIAEASDGPENIFLTATRVEAKVLQPLDLWLKNLPEAFPFIKDVIQTEKLGEENTVCATLNQETRSFNFAGSEITFVLIRDANDAPDPESLRRGTFLIDLTGEIESSYLNAQFVLQLLLMRKCNIRHDWDKVLNTLGLPEQTIQDFYYNIEDIQQLATYLTNGQFKATDFEYGMATA